MKFNIECLHGLSEEIGICCGLNTRHINGSLRYWMLIYHMGLLVVLFQRGICKCWRKNSTSIYSKIMWWEFISFLKTVVSWLDSIRTGRCESLKKVYVCFESSHIPEGTQWDFPPDTIDPIFCIFLTLTLPHGDTLILFSGRNLPYWIKSLFIFWILKCPCCNIVILNCSHGWTWFVMFYLTDCSSGLPFNIDWSDFIVEARGRNLATTISIIATHTGCIKVK